MVCPTPPARLCDARGRPYFLWDCDVTLDELREHLSAPDDDRRIYWLSKVMRQAKPDDAVTLASLTEIRRLWPRVEPSLGQTKAFWSWYLDWVGDAP
jgi:hypothetical protein